MTLDRFVDNKKENDYSAQKWNTDFSEKSSINFATFFYVRIYAKYGGGNFSQFNSIRNFFLCPRWSNFYLLWKFFPRFFFSFLWYLVFFLLLLNFYFYLNGLAYSTYDFYFISSLTNHLIIIIWILFSISYKLN